MNLDELEAAEQAEIAAKKKKNRKFSIFNRQKKDRPDVLPQDEYKGHDLKGFFIRYKRNFTKLVYVNFLIIFGNFPLWFLLIALSGAFKIDFTTPMSEIFPALHASSLLGDGVTPAQLLQYGIYGMQSPTTAMTATSYVFLGLSALTVFTFGIVNVGTTYIMRNMVKGEPVFIWTDFWYAVKRNFKQAFIYGIIDAVLLVLIPFNLAYLYLNSYNILITIFFYLTLIFSFIYFVMRFYIYLQMVTFDLRIGKILKNSLIFVPLGIKRNLMAFLGIILTVILNILSLLFLPPLGVALPLVAVFSGTAFMSCYAAYYKMKEIMIDPYYDENGNPIK
ncbi:MAG: DUF624 domain-containing protein [Clostridia bacterium]|nr:DUF624 domain-containing protein [Clostridia bacterium]